MLIVNVFSDLLFRKIKRFFHSILCIETENCYLPRSFLARLKQSGLISTSLTQCSQLLSRICVYRDVEIALVSIFLKPYCFPFSLLNKIGYKSGILYLIIGKWYQTSSILTAFKMSVTILGAIA